MRSSQPDDRIAFELSDVVSFHAYCSLPRLQRVIEQLRRYGRPLICIEWMGRHAHSRIQQQLPVLRREGIGSYMWGFRPWPLTNRPAVAERPRGQARCG